MKTEMDKQAFADRLNYSGDLNSVVRRLSDAYLIGRPTGSSIIEVGYEDCNVLIETAKGKYVAKIFAKRRSPEDITRYSTIMEKAVGGGVNHPPLMRMADGRKVVYTDAQANGISMVLMLYIEGKTFIELGRVPDAEELHAVIEQAARVNNIDYHPPYLFDPWAIPNIHKIFEQVRQFIQQTDLALVEGALARYNVIPVKTLPHCFVHGDFTKANVLKGDDRKIYILDFSVANWYPRIQELAVLTANLLHDENNPLPLRQKCELVAREYSNFNPLTTGERRYLYPYTIAALAMEFLGSHLEKYINGNDTKETAYWLNLGRSGLKRELT
jgi:Ser/Thr protein kinase RdoA (MazF antagonist)